MKFFLLILALFGVTACTALQKPEAVATGAHETECVIVLHGLMRTPRSMNKLQNALTEAGYLVVNDGYPSRDAEVEALADIAVNPAIANCREQGAERISFVTHSLGGILVRQYLANYDLAELGRVLMLAPPNKGSEAVDKLRSVPGMVLIYGPAVLQLGTDDSSIPRELDGPDFEVGIIAGASLGLFSGLLPGDDDGTVTIESARLEGASDFIVMDASHTFIMNNDAVINQVLFFLENGYFDSAYVD